ncbi:MAG: recombinase family protein [Xanthobacteraceae bacterium]
MCKSHARKGSAAMTIYGYARVSTDGQSVAAQDAALREAGAAKVYSEKVSGVVADRKALGACPSNRIFEASVLYTVHGIAQ